MKPILLQFSLPILFVFSCGVSNQVDGGGCSYKETISPARVISMAPAYKDSTYFNIWFEIDKEGIAGAGKDTISFYHTNNSHIEYSRVKALGLKTGEVYKYVIMDITKGHCNPRVDMIRLEKYDKG
ncbi:MAG: hypothetical protein K0Q66_909 [Chitinophagaceae bacterium]|nr:hypothetical protein [Chitinophagaceae bacterium]